VPDTQPTLFPQPVDEAMEDLRVTKNDLRRWYQVGWLSFNINDTGKLDLPQQNEIQFVRSLVLSGLGEQEIHRLLQGLPRPFSFDSRYIALHFEYGWVVPTAEKEPYDVIEENVADWLEDLASNRDVGKLRSLAEQIAEHLDAMSSEDANAD
jgi:hypothetical protein